MYATPKLLQCTRGAWLLALFALFLLAGCAGQRTTPASVVSVRTPPHTTPRVTQPTSRRTGITPKEVGYYLDALQGRLLQEMSKDISVARQTGRITVEIPSTEEPSQFQETLRSIAKVLIEYRLVHVTVRSTPAAAETKVVVEKHALDAARMLMQHGVADWRISVVGDLPPSTPAHVNLLLEPIVQSDGQPAGH